MEVSGAKKLRDQEGESAKHKNLRAEAHALFTPALTLTAPALIALPPNAPTVAEAGMTDFAVAA